MPYSERLKLVHVAIPKTGSTSAVRALCDLHKLHGGEVVLMKERIDRRFRRLYDLDRLPDHLPGRAKHLSAGQLRLILGDRYEQAFSYTFVRNPWARTVSSYFFTHEDSKPSFWERRRSETTRKFHRLDFRGWLQKKELNAAHKGKLLDQLDKVTDPEGNIIVDFIGRLEAVDEGFARIFEAASVEPIPIPYVNPGRKSRGYVEYYDDWSRDCVRELYKRDIDAFGYEFGA